MTGAPDNSGEWLPLNQFGHGEAIGWANERTGEVRYTPKPERVSGNLAILKAAYEAAGCYVHVGKPFVWPPAAND